MKRYLLACAAQQRDSSLTFQDAQARTSQLTTSGIIHELLTYPSSIAKCYSRILWRQQILAGPLSLPPSSSPSVFRQGLEAWSTLQPHLYFLIHLLGSILFMIRFRTLPPQYRRYLIRQLLPCLLVLLLSGLSFWQQDRLLAPTIALWLPAYLSLVFSTWGSTRPP